MDIGSRENTRRRQLPHGVTDLFYGQAATKVELERILQQTFERWGFQRIILPTFEYDDVLSTGASTLLQEEMYRFFDREGRVLALRPDMTVPTARVVGTKLYDQTLPLRLYYVGNVFRYEETQAGRRREFSQAGIELVGADTARADAEVLALAIASVEALGLERFQINLGQVAFVKAVLAETHLTDEQLLLIERVIGRKNEIELRYTLRELGIVGDVAHAIQSVLTLCGQSEVLQRARALCTNAEAHKAVDRLAEVYDLLKARGLGEHVLLDLGEVRSMAYYTGITFHGYVEGLGFHVCRGGRYDGLLADFGPPLPAVGFALGVERAMLVSKLAVDITPDLLVGALDAADCDASSTREIIDRARSQGMRVIEDVMGRSQTDLIAYGKDIRAKRILMGQDDGRFGILDVQGIRSLDLLALEEELRTWTS